MSYHLQMPDSGGRRATPRSNFGLSGVLNRINAATSNASRAASNASRTAARAKTTAANARTAGRNATATAQRATAAPRASTAGSAGYAGAGAAGYGGGGGGFGGGGIAPTSAPVEPPTPKKWEDLSEKEQTDYLAGDATYSAQEAALQTELENLMAELAMQRTNYETDYNSALTNLGWNTETESFDPNNMLGAYGMSFNNQQNDFAGRGMLDSTAYANALTDLGTSFDRQRGDLSNAQSNFMRELDTRQEGAERTNVQDLQRARADAIARRAAREGII